MEWIEIKSQTDISKLMDDFRGFHDSCISEWVYVTGMGVTDKKSMGCDSENSYIKVVFQSQGANPLEFCFEDINEVHIYDNGNYFNDIFAAAFFIEDEFICWADDPGWDRKNSDKEITYIVCHKAKYRSFLEGAKGENQP
ncbi:MAG: hypothetical protein LBS74_01635 [Oscillospiraceae bacterium]|jgi:hypothetical protein|nr:hypothetical protein [Oscillospiraceae bacterium]